MIRPFHSQAYRQRRNSALCRFWSVLFSFQFLGSSAFGLLDLNGNRVSDIWEGLNPNEIVGDFDADGDGYSTIEEIAAGTNPNDISSFLNVEVAEGDGAMNLSWTGVAGKRYAVEILNPGTGQWEDFSQIGPESQSRLMVVALDSASQTGLYRLVVGDADQDGDGLSAWEELQIGWNDNDVRSSGQGERLDYAAAFRAFESRGGMRLASGEILPPRLPTRNEASRFLMQASFGPTKESIDEVTSMGISGWLDRQRSLSPATMSNEMFRNGLPFVAAMPLVGWWRMANIAPDQLRQRVAYALSQILVVGVGTVEVIGSDPLNQSNYYDIFVREAFGNYREVLEQVTYSPAMGVFLSHLNNRKSDPSVNRFPDENFAREIMQLFTIGLWELNPDGSRKLNGDQFVPTYDNSVIREMAKVFTGMSFSRVGNNSRDATSFYDIGNTHDHRFPMKVWDEEHEPGRKQIIGGMILSDVENGEPQLSGEQEVQATLDALVNHPNIAPFIGRLLVQRLTSSNPSPGYLTRISTVWGAPSDPERGNLANVVEAIFLDPECRNPGFHPNSGKVREPVIRTTHLYRALNYEVPNGRYPLAVAWMRNQLGQFPLYSPSVFNFYSPDYSPQGRLSQLDLNSPEMEIITEAQIVQVENFHHGAAAATSFLDHSSAFEPELALAGDIDELLNYLNEILTAGRLRGESLSAIRQAVELRTTDLGKVHTAIQLIVTSPEFVSLE